MHSPPYNTVYLKVCTCTVVPPVCIQGVTSVGDQVGKVVVDVRARMASARHDTVDRLTEYQTKYRPTANKYNKWCAARQRPSLPSPPLPTCTVTRPAPSPAPACAPEGLRRPGGGGCRLV